ncbi:MAG: hypothetical protein GX230_06765 [Lentisphaerae bacterium]|nr:hypothetical protein [Lentisphaerota bacterium]
MLAYYVEWHMRQALAPLLYAEENLLEVRVDCDPVTKAVPTSKALQKKETKERDIRDFK